ncbi:ATP-binding protein [Achromobacter aloeverae]
MSLNPVRNVVRTSHFRIAAYFLGMFGLTGIVLIAYMYWQTTFYLEREMDAGLTSTVQRWSTLGMQNVRREVESRASRDPARHMPAALLSASGEPVGGKFELTAPILRFDAPFDGWQKRADGSLSPVRAVATVLDSGLVLLVGKDTHELDEFNERLQRGIFGAAVILLVLGMLGAAIVGRSAHRRLDATARSLRRIIQGDLAVRLPVRSAYDDLDRIAVMVNTMLDEIERLMGEVKSVTDDVAHDLRTPLTRMLAGLDRAQRNALPHDELKSLLASTADDARLLLRMFQGLLRISEIENTLRRDNFQPLDLARIARDAVEFFEPVAQERNLRLSFEAPGRPAEILGDPDLLFDALANLIDNATKFTPAGGRVAVRVARQADGWGLSVSDTGPGIPEAEREMVLRRFYRGERSRHAPGHGLGLSLVAAIAHLHGMTLEIDDARPGCRISIGPGSSVKP